MPLLYGKRPVLEVLTRSPARIEQLFLSLRGDFPKTSIPIKRVSPAELDSLCEGGHHQGYAAQLREEAPLSEKDLIEGANLLLVLDEINDPQNLGSILRAADCFGVEGILRTEKRSTPLSPAARRASAGASEFIRTAPVKNLQRTIRALKEEQIWVVGTSPGGTPIEEFSFPDRVALVLGSEGRGLRELTAKECDICVSLPMAGILDSLNVGQAASVFLYELRRQLYQREKMGG